MKAEKCVMVCMTPQESCSRLVQAGIRESERLNVKLMLFSVIRSFDEKSVEILNNLYNESSASGSEINIFVSDDPVLTAAVYAKRINACEIITGFPGERSSLFINHLHNLIPETGIIMVDKEGTQYKIQMPSKEELDQLKVTPFENK